MLIFYKNLAGDWSERRRLQQRPAESEALRGNQQLRLTEPKK
jgi:hypothetical protein